MAEHYSGDRSDWIAARHRLIDEVLAYRRCGRLEPSLLRACEAEFAVAPWTRSAGLRRLAELAQDGHALALDRLKAFAASSDWQVRYDALRALLEAGSSDADRRDVITRGLADRSARVRIYVAETAAFAHFIDMAGILEQAARRESAPKAARAIYSAAWHLRLNERTGERNRLGGSEADRDAFERDWTAFRADRTPTP
ncbi:hypothetical protein [Caulobacter mirabilis]|uniref:HEAT repeat domain-containing protein n=1 Tax=Caulobacter mirabilis TaxID=69666 RepID=A0A2D2AYP3_9CAUL|nr:hypothetical protein [Caulobacter mirabilis]ATQ43102.1 hypothetical protein CSW64_12105 [Caulobacter mirabilis]